MPINRDNPDLACCDCGDDIPIADRFFHYDGDDVRCQSCYEHSFEGEEEPFEDDSFGSILSYSTKPRTRFYHDTGKYSFQPNHFYYKGRELNRPYMGCELEGECPEDENRYEWAELIASRTNNLIYCKDDCSIHNGFEMVSHAMELDFVHNHSDDWRSAIKDMRKAGWRAWDASNCGFHIHIEKKSFVDAKHEMKFIYFIFRNKAKLVKFVGRNSEYARFNLESFINVRSDYWNDNKPNILEVVKGVRKDGGYVPGPMERNLAVNRSNENTHELRIFKPSLRFETLISYFEFTHCLWAFTKELDYQTIIKRDALYQFDVFAEFAHDNAGLYPHFVERLHKRRVVSKPVGWKDISDDK